MSWHTASENHNKSSSPPHFFSICCQNGYYHTTLLAYVHTRNVLSKPTQYMEGSGGIVVGLWLLNVCNWLWCDSSGILGFQINASLYLCRFLHYSYLSGWITLGKRVCTSHKLNLFWLVGLQFFLDFSFSISDGKYHVLPSGDLHILRVDETDTGIPFSCLVLNSLTNNEESSPPFHLTVDSKCLSYFF